MLVLRNIHHVNHNFVEVYHFLQLTSQHCWVVVLTVLGVHFYYKRHLYLLQFLGMLVLQNIPLTDHCFMEVYHLFQLMLEHGLVVVLTVLGVHFYYKCHLYLLQFLGMLLLQNNPLADHHCVEV